jgi:hypothetical protein
MSTRAIPPVPPVRFERLLAALPLTVALVCALAFGCSDAPALIALPATLATAATPSLTSSPAAPTSPVRAHPGTSNSELDDVVVERAGTEIAVRFRYDGTVTPAFTLGTGPDVYATQKAAVVATRQSDGRWAAEIGGLTPGTEYWVRLDNGKSTWYGAVRTLRRQVVVDLDSIRVLDAGPAGAAGAACAGLANRMVVVPTDAHFYFFYDKNYAVTSPRCARDGATLTFPGAAVSPRPAEGTAVERDYKGDEIWFESELVGADGCGTPAAACAPGARSERASASVVTPGTTTFAVRTKRPAGAARRGATATWYGRVVVQYVAW